MRYLISEMKLAEAEVISTWTYNEEYSIYSFTADQETIAELMSGHYFSVFDAHQLLIGYFCYGDAAKVPAGQQHGAYDSDNFIDIGLGLSPEHCGKKLGGDFLTSGIAYGRKRYGNLPFRLTVAKFNQRATNVYSRLGFVPSQIFTRKSKFGETQFVVMVLEDLI